MHASGRHAPWPRWRMRALQAMHAVLFPLSILPRQRGVPVWTSPRVSGLRRGAVCKTMRATTGGDHVPSPHALHEGNIGPGPGNSTARTCRAGRVRPRGQATAHL